MLAVLLVVTGLVLMCVIAGPTWPVIGLALLWLALAIPGAMFFGSSVFLRLACHENGISYRRGLKPREFPFDSIRVATFTCEDCELQETPITRVYGSIKFERKAWKPFEFQWSMGLQDEEKVFGPVLRLMVQHVRIEADDRMAALLENAGGS